MTVLVSVGVHSPRHFYWNARHGWVTFHHVTTQIGGKAGRLSFGRHVLATSVGPLDFVVLTGGGCQPGRCSC